MPSLFTDNFPISKTDDDLRRLQTQYPDYDGYYIASGSIADRRRFFNDLYKQFKPYADSNFLVDIKNDFHQRTWEMYLACILLRRGFQISSSDKGPDIKLVIGGKTIWIECVAPKKGSKDSGNYVPDMECNGEWQDVPEKQMLLRLRNSLSEKFKVYEKYISDGVVDKGDIFIIAINRASLDHVDTGIPLIFKVLFSLGYLSFPLLKDSEKKVSKSGKPFWSLRREIPKKNGNTVPMDFFQNHDHSGISAVIYSKDSVLNCRKKAGEECVLIHNPFASNPLSESTFSFFSQYKAIEDQIVKCN